MAAFPIPQSEIDNYTAMRDARGISDLDQQAYTDIVDILITYGKDALAVLSVLAFRASHYNVTTHDAVRAVLVDMIGRVRHLIGTQHQEAVNRAYWTGFAAGLRHTAEVASGIAEQTEGHLKSGDFPVSHASRIK